ncbi:MAG: VWA domain-containing protein [Bacteriovoracaceae bacterium]|nr:VWA domain-containing protein [Bacteriovoracaceae bacterium]
MEFRTPFLVILPLLTMVMWSFDFWKLFRNAQLHFPLKKMKQSLLNIKRWVLFGLGVVAWLFIAYAMMGPRKPLNFSPSQIEVNDIFMVIDVSRSMLADDIKPNRLEVAKQKIHDFLRLRPTDRIGIIIFSEKVFTLVPLTTDRKVIDEVVPEITVGNLGGGTNIGDALGLAVARAVDTETKNKVIVLLTDGVSNVGNMSPLQAAELAQKYKIKVYTIALGTDDDARIPVPGGVFGTRYQVIPGGSIDVKTLETISQMTGGKAYVAKSEQALQEILDDIQQLEKTKIESQGQIVYQEKYYQYLVIGIVLLMLIELLRRFYLKELL